MKSKELLTIHDLIVTDYTITPLTNGMFLHSFRPLTTATRYEFEANSVAVVKEGERYNIGYRYRDGKNIIDRSALSLSSAVDPMFSFLAAQKIAAEQYNEERGKNDRRVTHSANDDYYWGKKYAWRMFGACIAKEAFYAYLEEIGHKAVLCITQDSDFPSSNSQSIAYSETGLEQAVEDLIRTAVKVGRYYRSPLYSREFTIKGLNALTHKK